MKKIALILTLFGSTLSIAQGEANNWYFGEGAGLSFSATGAINSVNGGQLNTREGCASISDSDGNLLFYSDGSIVYNRNHQIMPNGTGLFGSSSATQSALIVPAPQNLNIYYIFTVDTAIGDDTDFGFNYSIINISLDGGLGAVTSKNINLLPDCSEKITAIVKDCQTESIWVITYATEDGSPGFFTTYHAFEVSVAGVNPTSVKSTFDPYSFTFNDQRGAIKISPDGTKFISANMNNGLYLYNFDSATGIISNELKLNINTISPSPYGVEFSPNSKLAYIHSSNVANATAPASSHQSSLTQFNLEAIDIQSSEFTVDQQQLYRGTLQLGPNGKIYRSMSDNYLIGQPYLSVINNPNVIGAACNYQNNAINLSPNLSSQGLPPFIQSFFNDQIDIIRNGKSITNLSLCDGDIYTLTANSMPNATYSWFFNDSILPENDFNLTINQTGHYQVFIDPNNGDCIIEGQAFVTYFSLPQANNSTLFQCDEDGSPDGFTLFNLTEANAELTGGIADRSTKFFLSLTDAENSSPEIDGNSFSNTLNPQTIYVQVINNLTDCYSISELILDVTATNANDAILTVCDNDGSEDGFYSFTLSDADVTVRNGLPQSVTLSYFETYEDALLEQNPLPNSYINTIAYSHSIYVRVENDNACYGINQVQLTVLELPNVGIENQNLYCLNFFPQTITLSSGLINNLPSDFTYLWNTGETTPEIQINVPDTYSVTVTNTNGCSKERTITVLPSSIATIESIEVTDATQNNTIIVSVSGEGIYQYALNDSNGPYQDSNLFKNVKPGIHTVYVRDTKNNCGIVQDIVSVIGFPKFFTPNNDSFNDTWQIYGLSSQFQPNSVIYIYDRYGKLLKQLDPTSNGWDGTFNGQNLPSNDYWFHVTLQDGRVFSNHFTLKR